MLALRRMLETCDGGAVRLLNAGCVQIASPAFGLSARTQAALKTRGIEKLFPIQASVLKPAMEGRDVIGRARTGTGKTLAFSLPVIEKMLVRAPCPLKHPSLARPCRPPPPHAAL